MFSTNTVISRALTSVFIVSLFTAPLMVPAQGDLVPISTITGSSVFVFRAAARAIRRTVGVIRPPRSKEQRAQAVAKLKKQYETVAANDTRRVKAPVVEKLPGNFRTLPPIEGAKVMSGVGEYYLTKNDYDQALQFYRDALSLDEKNVAANQGIAEALARKGTELVAAEKFELAKGMFLESLKYDPNNAPANFGLGEVYTELNQSDEAIAAYEKSLQSDAKLTEIYVPLGILYYQTGKIDRADNLLSKAAQIAPESAETQFFLGMVRMSQSRNEEALAAFQKAKTLDSKYAEAYYNAGEVYTRLKKYDEAIAEYEQATKLKPDSFDAWFGLGEALFAVKKYPEAIKAYSAAAKLKNDNWELFANLGDANRLNNAFAEAAAAYNLAILFYSRTPEPNNTTLADLYSKQGFSSGQKCAIDTAKAVNCSWSSTIKALQKAADITQSPIDYVNLGWAYFQAAHPDAEAKNMAAAMPNLELAKAAIEKALAGDTAVTEYALQNLAAVQIDMGDNKGAIETINKFLAKRPEVNFMRYQLGVAYFKSNDLANAEKQFRDAVTREPDYVFALTGLGETLLSRKNGKELKKVLEQLRPLDSAAASRLEIKAKALRII